jgi:hypothetical protein
MTASIANVVGIAREAASDGETINVEVFAWVQRKVQ